MVLLYLQRRQIAEALENFKNNLPPGGPMPPTHPSPACDGAFLRRFRPRKIQSSRNR
jgi:hypothetical protein